MLVDTTAPVLRLVVPPEEINVEGRRFAVQRQLGEGTAWYTSLATS